MHSTAVRFCPNVSLKNVIFIVSAHRLVNITLLTLVQATLWLFQGESPTHILNEDTHPVIRAIGVLITHSLQKTSFDEIFDLTAGVFSNFLQCCYRENVLIDGCFCCDALCTKFIGKSEDWKTGRPLYLVNTMLKTLEAWPGVTTPSNLQAFHGSDRVGPDQDDPTRPSRDDI